MNDRDELRDDLVGRYLNRESIEKAPEGFTDRMMNQLMTEPAHTPEKQVRKSITAIPLVSLIITIILILLAVFAGKTEHAGTNIFLTGLLKSINISWQVHFPDLSGFTVSDITAYVMSLSILLLVFDLALSRYFRNKIR